LSSIRMGSPIFFAALSQKRSLSSLSSAGRLYGMPISGLALRSRRFLLPGPRLVLLLQHCFLFLQLPPLPLLPGLLLPGLLLPGGGRLLPRNASSPSKPSSLGSRSPEWNAAAPASPSSTDDGSICVLTASARPTPGRCELRMLDCATLR